MSLINLLIKADDEWSTPKEAIQNGTKFPMELRCNFIHRNDIQKIDNYPNDLLMFWKYYCSAKLFEDPIYGQWGLHILSETECINFTNKFKKNRIRDALDGDQIFAEFLGDSECLLIRNDRNSADYGHVFVVLPLDPRQEWYLAANSLEEFLRKYIYHQGAKFWLRAAGS